MNRYGGGRHKGAYEKTGPNEQAGVFRKGRALYPLVDFKQWSDEVHCEHAKPKSCRCKYARKNPIVAKTARINAI